ncbi:hypothetical protein GCM10022226_32920 [Sphaerisporangium flaviroseum]|uniref:Secreted protein n=1 Tax=Sphaerisporangium flaviroseum TaxID=509199 RepID=A0ABP7I3N6_9ACTN
MTPLSQKVLGTGLAPVRLPVNPMPLAVALVAMEPLWDMLVAVTCAPDCVHVAFQPDPILWPESGKSNSSFQLLTGSPRLVMATSP